MIMIMIMVIMMVVVVLSKDTSIYDKIEASFIAGLIGDSLALAGHYEYDAVKIKAHVGEYRNLMAPGEGMGGKTHGVGWGSANYHVMSYLHHHHRHHHHHPHHRHDLHHHHHIIIIISSSSLLARKSSRRFNRCW